MPIRLSAAGYIIGLLVGLKKEKTAAKLAAAGSSGIKPSQYNTQPPKASGIKQW
jgi:hypothetical protein